jgi:hypothetical protein
MKQHYGILRTVISPFTVLPSYANFFIQFIMYLSSVSAHTFQYAHPPHLGLSEAQPSLTDHGIPAQWILFQLSESNRYTIPSPLHLPPSMRDENLKDSPSTTYPFTTTSCPSQPPTSINILPTNNHIPRSSKEARTFVRTIMSAC